MAQKQIYIFTRKDCEGPHLVAYNDFKKSIEVFNGVKQKYVDLGYNEITQAIHDDITYIKVCKLTKDEETVRLRLENVPLIEVK